MDFDTLIVHALDSAGPTRRDRVFAVLDVYQRHTGSLPGIQEVRNLVGRGSYGDISRDLKDYRQILASRTEQMALIPGLPADLELKLGEVMGGLWQTIYERAQQEFLTEKEAIELRLAESDAKREEADKERLHALEERQSALTRISVVEGEAREARENLVAEQGAKGEALAMVVSLQARIGEMEAERLRVAAEHKGEVMALGAQLKERENRILDLHGAQKTLEAGYQEKIDAARQLETAHKLRADKAENARAELQDRYEAASSSLAVANSQHADLQTRLAAAEKYREQALTNNAAQVALLARDLALEKDKVLEVIQDNTRLANEVTALKVVIEEREGRIRVLGADAT